MSSFSAGAAMPSTANTTLRPWRMNAKRGDFRAEVIK